MAPSDLADVLAELGPGALAAGDGAVAFRGVLQRSGAVIADDGRSGAIGSRLAITAVWPPTCPTAPPATFAPTISAPPTRSYPVRSRHEHRASHVRALGFSDLPQVISIERRAFPTPWSLSMFVLELSKPSGVCLAAVADKQRLGYLICARYADVWHLMNIAVDPAARRRGVASAMLEQMLVRAGPDEAVHARGAHRRTPARSRCMSASAFAARARAGATTATPGRTP